MTSSPTRESLDGPRPASCPVLGPALVPGYPDPTEEALDRIRKL